MTSAPLVELRNLTKAYEEGGRRRVVLLIGRDALDATESTSSKLAAFASSGRAVVVLEENSRIELF